MIKKISDIFEEELTRVNGIFKDFLIKKKDVLGIDWISKYNV